MVVAGVVAVVAVAIVVLAVGVGVLVVIGVECLHASSMYVPLL